MSSPVVVRVSRPYANEEEYLANERFSIDSKSMLLIDQEPLAAGTPVVFEVLLQNGEKPIRAEGRVVGHVAPSADAPGGLRVRFKRFGAATKAFIARATAATPASPALASDSAPTERASGRPAVKRIASISSSSIDVGWSMRPAAPEPATEATEAAPASRRPVSRRPVSRRPASISSTSIDVGWSVRPAAERAEASGVHSRPVAPVAAPANREELLARLRGRTRRVAS